MMRHFIIWFVIVGNLVGGLVSLAMGAARWKTEPTHKVQWRRWLFGGGLFRDDPAWNLLLTAGFMFAAGIAVFIAFISE